MLRTIIGALSASTLLAASLATAPPARAHPVYHPWGTLTANNQRLLDGCHRYPYRYKITAPTEEWQAEILLVNPNRRPLASMTLDRGADPDQGTRYWTICRASTVSGRYTMKMKITYNTPDLAVHEGYVHPTSFRIAAPGR